MRAVLAATVVVMGLGFALVAAPIGVHRATDEKPQAEKLTELVVRDVIPLSAIHQAAIILTPTNGRLVVPVLVTEDEGQLVAGQLHGQPNGRGILRQAIAGMGGKLLRVELQSVRGDSVVANVVVEHGGKSTSLQGTAADSIGLAVEEHVPVMATKAVLDGLGLTREQIRALVQSHGDDGAGPSGPSAGEHELQPSSNGETISL